MATVSTITSFKSSLIKEVDKLAIHSDKSSASSKVQTGYGPIAVDKRRSESVWFADEMNTVAVPEQRLVAGRRRRQLEWEVDLHIYSAVKTDTEEAETRAFIIAGEIENFLADNAQPGEWPNHPTTTSTLHALVVAMRSELSESESGAQAVEVTMTLSMKERLT